MIRTREYLSAMFVRDEALVLMLLRFPQEIKAAAKLDLPSATAKEFQPGKREMELAEKLINEMSGKWNPDDYHDEYREALMDFIERKISKGDSVDDVKEGEEEDEHTDAGKILDLADYLERSMKSKSAPAKKTVAKKAPAKKAAAKKTTTKHAKKAATKKAKRSA